MANFYTGIYDTGNNAMPWALSDTAYCDSRELYRTLPIAGGSINYRDQNGNRRESSYTGISVPPNARTAGYIQTGTGGQKNIHMGNSNNYCVITATGDATADSTQFPLMNYVTHTSGHAYLYTNVPVFLTLTEADNYVRAQTDEQALEILKDALNYVEGVENDPETEDWYIYNTYEAASIDLGIVTYTGDAPTGRFEIFKANSKPALYYVDRENSCELKLIASQIVGSVYSSVNKQDVMNKQFDSSAWTQGALYYTGPWYHTLEYLPDGDYTIGVTWDSNILIFPDKETAEGYIAGLVSEEVALNYGSVGKPAIATNETGIQELITTFGGNESENVFSHDYLMSRTELADVGGKFFDTNILQALLDGLKLYGNNPMDSVLSCLYFPFDLSTICTSTSVTSIYFGSYEMENVSAKKVSTRSGYKELGSTFIKPTFYNWLDYEAMHIYLYLPYIGFVELDVSKYLNKWLKSIYMVDLHSGECEVSLCADALLMDTYSGQIGIKQLISYNDMATYFQSQITALRNGVMSSVGLPVAGTATGAGIGAQTGNPYGAAAGAIAGAAVTAPFVAPNAIYQGVKVANYKPPLFSKGGYSSEIGANMPQYAFLVFMYNDTQEPDNLVDIFGKPSNESGTVGSFSGFLSVSSVNLQCSGATDAEKSEIVSLLHNGIYI